MERLLIKAKGDIYMVDTTVTGSNEGMSDKLKFPLKSLFKEVINALLFSAGWASNRMPLLAANASLAVG